MNNLTNEIYKILQTRFGSRSCELRFNNNYELIVCVILSARCTDKRVNLITPELFKNYPTVFDLSNAKQEDIEKLIFSCGFYKNKAKSLISMANDIVKNFNGIVPSEFDELLKLKGVGRKTANVVLSVGFNKNAIAVDTHVFRLSNRLGFVNAKTPFECEKSLQKIIDEDKWSQFHHYLVLFGRYICSSQKPNCKECELKKYCLKYNNKDFIDKKY